MKRFLITTGIFFLPLLLMSIAVEVIVRQVPNPYSYKYEYMQQHADEVQTLVLGSSHAFYGIRPEYLGPHAFSLANVSQDLHHDAFLLGYWAEHYRHLRTVIVPISYFTCFSHGLEHGQESYRCRFYKIYMDCDYYPDFSTYNIELPNLRAVKDKLQKWLRPKPDPGYDAYGWGTTNTLANKDSVAWQRGDEAAAAVKRHYFSNWDALETNYAYLSEMADFCHHHGIRMVLVTTPCWKSYVSQLDAKQLGKMSQCIRRLQKEKGLTYLNYLKDSRFGPDDFYDSNHLSEIGAEKFSKILAGDL